MVLRITRGVGVSARKPPQSWALLPQMVESLIPDEPKSVMPPPPPPGNLLPEMVELVTVSVALSLLNMPPAKLPEMVELFTTRLALASLNMPPQNSALFREIVELVTMSEEALYIPPPKSPIGAKQKQSKIVQCWTVRIPGFEMPPPIALVRSARCRLPLEIVSPANLTAPCKMLRTRLVLLPLIVNDCAPDPLSVRSLSWISPVVSTIVP